MFGYVTASWKELSKQEQERYGAVYCGICRRIRSQSGQGARLGLSYDMAFLALLLMSLYEPEETGGKDPCILHPVTKRGWVDNPYVRYAADMNVALAYYNCLDDWQDEHRTASRMMARMLQSKVPPVQERWPRQCQAIAQCIQRLNQLERENCPNPDEPAGAFGELMAQILTYQQDLWAPTLAQMGFALGRFIYLVDAAVDYDRDKRQKRYNPFLAMGMEKDWKRWEEYLVLAMGRCTENFERLPLVQDKGILDNILYSGVWLNYRGKAADSADDGRSL